MKFQKRRVSYWIPLAILMVLMSLMMVYCQSQENLNVYTEPDASQSTDPTEATSASSIELETHLHDTLKISYGIPEGWQKVTMDGYTTYIHSPSAASVQLQIMDFNPYYITLSEQIMSAELQNAGLILESFQWNDNTSYTCIYRKGDTQSGTVYVDQVTFDKAHVVRLFLSWPLKYYDRLLNDMLAIADSFNWEKEKPYPENISLVYNTSAKCEFGYPTGWYTKIDGNVYLAQDPETKTLMTVTINPSTVKYDQMSQLDYVNWASSGRTSFALVEFQKDTSTIYATSTYSSSGTSIVLIHYMYASGTYEYMITFEIPMSVYEQKKELVSTLINNLKIY